MMLSSARLRTPTTCLLMQPTPPLAANKCPCAFSYRVGVRAFTTDGRMLHNLPERPALQHVTFHPTQGMYIVPSVAQKEGWRDVVLKHARAGGALHCRNHCCWQRLSCETSASRRQGLHRGSRHATSSLLTGSPLAVAPLCAQAWSAY